MSMKNLVIPKLQWDKHPSRHRSSGDRVSSKHRQQPEELQSPPLRVEPITEKVKSSACGGSMPSSLRRHSSIGDDDTGVHSSSSSKCKKPVIEYSRHPPNSVSKNGELRVEKVEVRKNGLVLGEKGSRSTNNSVPVRKKKSLMNNDKDNSAMERKKTVVLVKAEKEEEDREQIGVMVAEPEQEEKEEEGMEIGFMAVKEEEEEEKETEVMGSKEEEEERKDVLGAMPDAKTWNFRPRNPIRRSLNLNGSNFGFGRLTVTPKCPSPMKKHEVVVEKKKKESVKDNNNNNSKKRCLTAIITEDEFKEDINRWAQVGLRPPKKHIKRPKCVQKQVNIVYPGAYLDSIPVTSDLYRVSKKDVGLT